MIPTQLIRYPEQFAKRLSDMEREIAELKRKVQKLEAEKGNS